MPKPNVDNRLKLKIAETGTKQSKKAAKDPYKPRRPHSAFFVFMSDFREQFLEENPYTKCLTVDKAPYIAKAEKKKEEYEKTLLAYNDRLNMKNTSRRSHSAMLASSSATGSASSIVAAPASSNAVAPASAALPNLCRVAPASSYAVAPASAALPNLRCVAPASAALPNLRRVAPASAALPNLRLAEQVHDNASQFQKKGCEHYKRLGMLLNKNSATRVLHHSSIQDPLDTEEENELERQYINTESGRHAHPHNDSSDDIQEVEGITHNRKRKIHAKAHTSNRESKSHQMREALALWAEASMAKVEGYRRVDDSYSLANCVTALGEIQGISEDTYMKALDKFKDPDWREMFIVMPNDTNHDP